MNSIEKKKQYTNQT